eukprot:5176773-Ditylum_brightwellii.AAC.1
MRSADVQNDVHTITIDFAQNLSLPWFGHDQPGQTYFLTPITVNFFNAIDNSHEKSHLHAMIYKEDEGKRGGTEEEEEEEYML